MPIQPPIHETAYLRKRVASLGRLRPETRAILEHLDFLLEDYEHRILASYRLIAEHLIKWVALPHMRSDSWRSTVERERSNLHDHMEDGTNAVRDYVLGLRDFNRQVPRISPEAIYKKAIAACAVSYANRHGVPEKEAARIFVKAVPAPYTLDQLRSLPMLYADIPEYARGGHARTRSKTR